MTHLLSTRIIQLRGNLDKHRMDIMAVDHNGMHSLQFEHFWEIWLMATRPGIGAHLFANDNNITHSMLT